MWNASDPGLTSGWRDRVQVKHHDGGIEAALLAAERTNYDLNGRAWKEEAGMAFSGANVTAWQKIAERGFTPTGQVAWERNGADNTTNFLYDPADRLLERADPLNRRTRFQYDLAGQMLQEIRAYGTGLVQYYATYTYSPNGQRLTVKDANNNLSSFEYDGFDRLAKWRFPVKTPVGANASSTTDYEEYGYDANGNRSWLRKRDGKVIHYAHDTLNRLTRTWYTGVTQAEVHRTYDLAGRPEWVRFDSPSGPGIQYQYNPAKHLQSETSFNRTVSFQYDEVYNRTRLTYPDGHYIQYVYDALNRVTQVRENGATSSPGLLATYSYDPLSRRTNLARGNATTTAFSFDLASRLTSMSHDLGGTTHDAVFSYNWTIASQLARRHSSNGTLSAWPVTARNDSYAVNGLNQYTQVTGRSYVHDDNGNLINNGLRNYAYDVENRLVSVSGSPSMTLSYDPLGRLRQTVVNGQTVQFLYEGDRLIAEYNGSTTTVLRRYVHGPGIDEPIVWYEGSALNSNTRRWLHTDERGSVIAHSVANGTATTYSYGPYGEPGNGNWTGSRFRYTGQIALPEAQLYHYKARVYDPIDGRFLQTDPIGYEDDVNLYVYVRNDPGNRFDPYGQDSYVVARRLDNAPAGALRLGHAYVVTNATHIGDRNATIHPYGRLSNGNMGNVSDVSQAHAMSEFTAREDFNHWTSLSANTASNLSQINAPDSVVDAVAGALKEDLAYSLVPKGEGTIGLDPSIRPEGNSNSGAFAVGDRSVQIATGDPNAKVDRTTFTLTLPGASQSDRVGFNCTQDLQAAGGC